MSKDKPEPTAASVGQGRGGELAGERASLEDAGRNWEASHVADLVGLSVLTVKRRARKGTLPAVKVGRGWVFPPPKVRAWYAGEPWTVSASSRPPARKKTKKKKKKS